MGLTQRLDELIDTALAEDRIVGTVVMVAENGKRVYGRAAGYADREAGIPVTEKTIFRLASVTKPIVAATALALVDKGVVQLDAPVTDYLPFFTPPLPDGSVPVIQIHNLLTHTAGLTYDPDVIGPAGVSGGLDDTSVSLMDNMKKLAKAPLRYEPGTSWEYGMAIDVLGAVVEAASGKKLSDAVAEHVTGPLGMNDTKFGVADESRLSKAYANSPDGAVLMGDTHTMENPWGGMSTFQPTRIFNPDAFQSGGAGMAGTSTDFLTLLEAFQSGGAPIVSERIARLALSNRIGDITLDGRPGEAFGYLGAVVMDGAANNNPQTPGTSRWGGVYGNSWFLDPERKLSVSGFTNTAFEGSDGLFREQLRMAVYG